MEMHSQQSLYDTHRISVMRARLRRRATGRFGLARIVAFLKAAVAAMQAELAARRAMAQLASMDDHQLRDIGVSRCEIGRAVRGLPNVGTKQRAGAFAREARISGWFTWSNI
jgi:uncharacterized protein YjiS (DUF1127 family)